LGFEGAADGAESGGACSDSLFFNRKNEFGVAIETFESEVGHKTIITYI
jgi:hypothetical protein